MAQKKTAVVHYITARSLKSFFCDRLCRHVALDKIKNICNNSKIDYKSIIENKEYINSCMHAVDKKDLQILNDLHGVYFNECSDECALKKNLEKQFQKKFDEVFEYKIGNSHYLKNFGENFNDGYVVDFCDIRSFPFFFAKKIEAGVENFWEDKDYIKHVLNEDTNIIPMIKLKYRKQLLSYVHRLKSPELEHLMQRFAHNFIRIGIDDIEDDEKQSIFKQFLEKNHEVHLL